MYELIFLIGVLLFLFICYYYEKKNSFVYEPVPEGVDWLNEIFERRQIIAIPSRKDNVTEFCKSLAIKETIFKAILKDNIKYNNKYNLKMGEIACALSQEKVLRDFLMSNDKTLIMFEDDIMPISHKKYVKNGITLSHVRKYVNKCFKNLPDTWDVLYLGRCWDNCAKHSRINKYIVKVHKALCHHAIAFTKKGAEKILSSIRHPLKVPIDHVVSNLCSSGMLECYATSVPIFYQNRDELSTTIGNFDNLPVCS